MSLDRGYHKDYCPQCGQEDVFCGCPPYRSITTDLLTIPESTLTVMTPAVMWACIGYIAGATDRMCGYHSELGPMTKKATAMLLEESGKDGGTDLYRLAEFEKECHAAIKRSGYHYADPQLPRFTDFLDHHKKNL